MRARLNTLMAWTGFLCLLFGVIPLVAMAIGYQLEAMQDKPTLQTLSCKEIEATNSEYQSLYRAYEAARKRRGVCQFGINGEIQFADVPCGGIGHSHPMAARVRSWLYLCQSLRGAGLRATWLSHLFPCAFQRSLGLYCLDCGILANCNLITVSHERPLQDLALADMTRPFIVRWAWPHVR